MVYASITYSLLKCYLHELKCYMHIRLIIYLFISRTLNLLIHDLYYIH